jgi:transposase
MNMAPGFIGIDVSRDHLDIFEGTALRITNTAEAITAYVAGLCAPRLILFEATGRYDRVQQQLQAADIGFARVNPPQARSFIRTTGQLAISGGPSEVRKALYMAALSAIRANPTLAAFFKSLTQRGKARSHRRRQKAHRHRKRYPQNSQPIPHMTTQLPA